MYKAAKDPTYESLIRAAVEYAKSLDTAVTSAERLSAAVDFLAVQFGTQIYSLTGRISTEVDVALSFDADATVASALRLLELYKAQGVPREAVRIKISGTWEGIQAARVLQRDHGASCLVTVVFSLVQAIAAAEAGVDAIAPYVGRLADWGRLHGIEGDHGVATVSKMQNYLRKFGYKTQVMAASFRTTTQVRALAGVDLLTASPEILEAMLRETEPVAPKLTRNTGKRNNIQELILNLSNPSQVHDLDVPKISYINDEPKFRWDFNQDECAVEKSADAMRQFGEDTERLKAILQQYGSFS